MPSESARASACSMRFASTMHVPACFGCGPRVKYESQNSTGVWFFIRFSTFHDPPGDRRCTEQQRPRQRKEQPLAAAKLEHRAQAGAPAAVAIVSDTRA